PSNPSLSRVARRAKRVSSVCPGTPLHWIESSNNCPNKTLKKFHPLPGGLEPLGKRRKESGRRRRPARAELAGASESLGRGDGERKYQSVYRGNKSYF